MQSLACISKTKLYTWISKTQYKEKKKNVFNGLESVGSVICLTWQMYYVTSFIYIAEKLTPRATDQN